MLSIAKTTRGYEGKLEEENLHREITCRIRRIHEDMCRRLAAELRVIQQERGESVEQFAFKYKKRLHQPEKLSEKIAKDSPTFTVYY